MALEVSGFPADARILSSPIQKAEQRESGEIIFTIDNALLSEKVAVAKDDPANHLKSSDQTPSDDPALLARKAEIIGSEKDPEKIIEKLAAWVAAHVKDSVSGNASPLDTIRKGEGDCLDHARLYSSLARAAGIPTKIVLGLAYFQDRGFLYHCWAESFSGRWLPVDPVSGEIPANATHVKLAEGDTDDDLLARSGIRLGQNPAVEIEVGQRSLLNCRTPEALPLGLMLSSVGIGAVTGAILVASLPEKARRGRLLTMGNLALPALLLGFVSTHSFVLALILLVLVGLGQVFQNVLANTLLQITAPDELRGRVMGVYTMTFQTMFRLGGLQAGFVADWLGAPISVGIGAVLSLLYGLFVAIRYPKVRQL